MSDASEADGEHTGESLGIGDVVSALFPLHQPGGHEQQGYRPAVVVGLPELVGSPRFDLLIVAPMTSDKGQEWAEASPDLYPRFAAGTASLRSSSICLLDQIRSLDTERVARYFGTLSKEEYEPICKGLGRILRSGDNSASRA